MNKKIFVLLAAVFGAVLFTGCGKLGYSLVLWNNPEIGVQEGQIVKVYVKSNISQTYIIMGLEDSQKKEIPLWQISQPASKAKTEKLAGRYEEYAHTYASVKLDGLPIRAEAVNTSRQVYRLRKDEVIRVLYKGKGQAVTNGKGDLQGEWLRVLTGTGTEGWCFSYNLNLFEREDDLLTVKAEVKQEERDEELAAAVARRWYPEEYKEMLSTGRYDLAKMDENYGFDFGQVDWQVPAQDEAGVEGGNGTSENPVPKESLQKIPVPKTAKDGEPLVFTAVLRTADQNKTWTYSKAKKKEDGSYQLDENGVYITLAGKNTLAVQYMDSDGKLKNENFVSLTQDIQGVIEAERERRKIEVAALAAEGPVYHSSNYGTITFTEDGNAFWSNFKLLVPGIISARATGTVKVGVELYLANSLKSDFDGILTFSFEGMEEKVNFFYKKDAGGLRLEDATRAVIRGNLVTARGSSPLVMYFSASQTNQNR